MERSVKKRPLSVRKNDVVVVISGSDKGKKGKILEVLPSEGRVIVEKVNIVKRHQKPTQQQRQGGIIEKEAKIDASNVQPFCPKCGKPVRIGHKLLENGKKVRVCRKCDEMLDLS